eukprot:1552182-Rhodomonas_salina.4
MTKASASRYKHAAENCVVRNTLSAHVDTRKRNGQYVRIAHHRHAAHHKHAFVRIKHAYVRIKHAYVRITQHAIDTYLRATGARRAVAESDVCPHTLTQANATDSVSAPLNTITPRTVSHTVPCESKMLQRLCQYRAPPRAGTTRTVCQYQALRSERVGRYRASTNHPERFELLVDPELEHSACSLCQYRKSRTAQNQTQETAFLARRALADFTWSVSHQGSDGQTGVGDSRRIQL